MVKEAKSDYDYLKSLRKHRTGANMPLGYSFRYRRSVRLNDVCESVSCVARAFCERRF
jgi:hypothetical protein